MKYFRNLLIDFLHRNLQYAEYYDSNQFMPQLVIKKLVFPTKQNNPFSIHISISDYECADADFDFLVYKSNTSNVFYWSTLDEEPTPHKFYSTEGPFSTWEEALSSLEIFLFSILDIADYPNSNGWDTCAEF